MPLYTYKCPNCGAEETEFNKVDERHTLAPTCCEPMNLKIMPTQIPPQILGAGSLNGYRCPVTDQWVTSYKQKRQIMKDHDLVEVGDDSPAKRERRERVKEETKQKEL